MYFAHQIAIYIINWHYYFNIPITNLRLQKLLYFVQGEYYHIQRKRLIKEDFYAWQLGPVIPEIYFEFSMFSSSNIPLQKEAINLDTKKVHAADENIINKILMNYKSSSTWDLVELSHKQDPWKYNYEVFGNKSIIPFESICNYFGSGESN